MFWSGLFLGFFLGVFIGVAGSLLVRTLPALLLLFLLPAVLFGQTQNKAQNKAEIRLADGSVLRGSISDQAVIVLTKYGTLTIPYADITQIEFGVHLPDYLATAIEIAVADLGHGDAKRREAATNLLGQQSQAYTFLLRAAQDKDQEISKRANIALARIRKSFPTAKLKEKIEDVVYTKDGKIVGRIGSAPIKAWTAAFGETQLPLHHFYSIRFQETGVFNLAVDGAKLKGQWFDTGLEITTGMAVTIHAEGEVDLWPPQPGQYRTGPKGYANQQVNGWQPGALVAKVAGREFAVGEDWRDRIGDSGRLYLRIVPAQWQPNDVSGVYRVRVNMDFSDR